MPTPNITQLKQALSLAERIEKLQEELSTLLDNGSAVAAAPRIMSTPVLRKGKRTMSAAARARIAAAQRARWAKAKGMSTATAKPASPPRKRGKLSAEGRARIVAALKKRWADKKKAATK